MTAEQKVDAYMPLWIGEYLADTMGFKAIQHGAYLLLLMAYWRQRAPLADDDDELAGIARVTPAEWKAIRPKLERKFQVGDGKWSHRRCEKELADALARKTKASGKAKKAAESRWGGHTSISPSNAPSIGQALLGTCPSTSTLPSPSESSDPDGSAAADAPAPVDNSGSPAPPPPPADPPPEPTPSRKQAAWNACGEWLMAGGVAKTTAREIMGAILRDYPDVGLDALEAAAKANDTGEVRAYLHATAKRLKAARDGSKHPTPSAAETAELLRRQSEPMSDEQKAAADAARQRAVAAHGSKPATTDEPA